MLLNESDLKTLIKDILKEVKDEEHFSDDMLFFPDEYEFLYMPRQNESPKYVDAVRKSLIAIRQKLELFNVKHDSFIYSQTADKDKMEIPSNVTDEVLDIIISVCKSLDESLSDEKTLRSEYYKEEDDRNPKTIADIVAMFIPRKPPQQEAPTDHQHL